MMKIILAVVVSALGAAVVVLFPDGLRWIGWVALAVGFGTVVSAAEECLASPKA
jgi:hypothetical protein